MISQVVFLYPHRHTIISNKGFFYEAPGTTVVIFYFQNIIQKLLYMRKKLHCMINFKCLMVQKMPFVTKIVNKKSSVLFNSFSQNKQVY